MKFILLIDPNDFSQDTKLDRAEIKSTTRGRIGADLAQALYKYLLTQYDREITALYHFITPWLKGNNRSRFQRSG